ncbi:MAG: hypothetical protein GY790_19940 [Bacteroidetes bacterium]|nr:hypothetical protein [Bacteroidota bacterium]
MESDYLGLEEVVVLGYGTQKKHNLSISGGNKSVNYYLSCGYLKDKGVLKDLTDG